MKPKQFKSLKRQVDALTPTNAQAYALTWTEPFRVGCMSITTAFAMGYSTHYCASGCKPTKPNPYFNSTSSRPHHDYGLRPAMMLAGKDSDEITRLIDRGISSDKTYPHGTAYLLRTSDQSRNSRVPIYRAITKRFKGLLDVRVLDTDYLENKKDVMFYFTGMSRVPKLRSNNFLPGAIGDHLTSSGGRLTDSPQMSSLRWLEAGATGSYGAVVEPCNFPQKFPNPAIAMASYISGESLIEAYWKSVAWPGQGLFIGEPLAQPFAVKH